jgi:acyl-CoA synthetase (AMP-forming)/AMP-acid ligase II
VRSIDYFDKAAEAFPDRIALIDGDTRFTYRELRLASERLARAMIAAGLRDEERVAIYSPNDARVLFCMVAIMRAGGAWVPINYRNANDANIQFMNYAETRWLFYHSSFREQAQIMRSQVPALQHFICIDAEDGKNSSLAQFMELGAQADVPDWADARGNPGRLVGLVPTGGTTGPAKGVRVTCDSWGAFIETAAHYWQIEGGLPVCLSTAPLSHAAGVIAYALFTLGATNVILPRFDAGAVLQQIEHHRVTHLFLPPTAYYALLAHPEVRQRDHSSLKLLLLAASPVSPDRVKQGVEIFGPCVCQSYGQTEAPMIMTWLDQKAVAAAAAGDHPGRLRSCGKASYGVRLGIMDEQGHLLPANQTGEIVARGTLVTPGYHNLPEATAEIRTYGWHHTGDVGYYDEGGYFYIVDRKKDMIITGGFNVYSAEVESCLMALPAVFECAVVGVPHEKWGEAVKAFVVIHEGALLTQDEVISHCKTQLGSVKSPKSVEFCQEIPKTPAGKIDRKKLRAPYWEGVDRKVH